MLLFSSLSNHVLVTMTLEQIVPKYNENIHIRNGFLEKLKCVVCFWLEFPAKFEVLY